MFLILKNYQVFYLLRHSVYLRKKRYQGPITLRASHNHMTQKCWALLKIVFCHKMLITIVKMQLLTYLLNPRGSGRSIGHQHVASRHPDLGPSSRSHSRSSPASPPLLSSSRCPLASLSSSCPVVPISKQHLVAWTWSCVDSDQARSTFSS